MKKDAASTKKVKKKNFLFRAFIVFLLCFIVTGIAGSIHIYGLVQSAPEIDEDAFVYSNSSTLYDHNDEPMVTINNGEDRQSTNLEQIPQHVQDAFIAIEDVRFYEHSGLDLKRVGGALVSNIKNGFGSAGGSTITQQVVKNSLLTSDKTIERKVQEAYLALELEKEYTKDEILELYLNKIYFGKGAYGIVIAADTYFGKSMDELTVEEAALLAGLPQRPSAYDPFQNPELAEERRNTVLFVMKDHGFITDEEYREAKSVSVEDMTPEKSNNYDISDAFMDQVYKELEDMEEVDPSMVYSKGLEIYTTYDKEAQEHVEKVLNTDEFVSYPNELFQAGLTVVDNETGEIKAIGGGRNQESGKSRTNYATTIKRSPGSTIKPILSYGPAIEHLKWSTYQQIEDEEMTYTDSDQVIQNYNNNYHGIVSMREALKQSWNIPAVKTFQEVGNQHAEEFASNVGLTIEGPLYESYALGSFEEGISPLELAGAYAAFGNEGTYNEPHVIRKVVLPDGKEINMQPEPVEAMSDYTSYMVTDMLQTVVEEGTGRLANIEGVAVAGKTGTTNFNEETKQEYNITDGVPDVWFAGYTTNYTVAVWTGYPQINEENYIKTEEEKQIARHIFREVMAEMVDENTQEFKKPDSVEEITIDTKTGERTTKSSTNDDILTELFVTGTSIKDAYSLVEDEWEKKQKKAESEKRKSREREDNNSDDQEDDSESDREDGREEEDEESDSDQEEEREEDEESDSDQEEEREEDEESDSDQEEEREEDEESDSDQEEEREEDEESDSDQEENGEEDDGSDSDQEENNEEEEDSGSDSAAEALNNKRKEESDSDG
ncbi:PBP1A family penicillin-binding protein [Virgibacillus sp. C22-A2]|uniref:PBP1A family penicillin-binding protein n=1 Tax=Virgibacillus tibetensis TaxID=3042313 RepID=A0ABU6KFX1_9BACI|nr:PBP1A family penicillin-binding protein [Virgibacillus sp. C22-A2]